MVESCNLDIVLLNHESNLAAVDILGVRVTLGWGFFLFNSCLGDVGYAQLLKMTV